MERLNEPVKASVPSIVMFLQESVLSFIETVAVLTIVTSSVAVGKTPPTQVVLALQSPPEAVELICPSTPKETNNKKTKAITLPLKGNSLNAFSRKGLSEMIFEFSIVNAHVYKPTRL